MIWRSSISSLFRGADYVQYRYIKVWYLRYLLLLLFHWLARFRLAYMHLGTHAGSNVGEE